MAKLIMKILFYKQGMGPFNDIELNIKKICNYFIGITVYNNIGITDKEENGNERTDKIRRIGHDCHLASGR